MPHNDAVFVEREGPVATIQLNRPAKRNALTVEMWKRLNAIAEELDRDTAVKVVVVTGAGETFAAGADIEEFEKSATEPKLGEKVAEVTYDAQKRLARNAKPTIAKIRGACVGGGCGIAICCDLRFADTTAKFAITPGKLGLIYSVADTKRLVDLVGPARAKDILYTGRMLDAQEAKSIGLIDRVVDPGDLDKVVMDYARTVAANSQFSARGTKHITQMILDGAIDDDRETRRLFVDAFSGADFKEGVAAFLAKRKPVFPVS